MIRTTKHSLKFCNTQKKQKIESFVDECLRVLELYVDYVWNNRIEWDSKDKSKHIVLDIKNEEYEYPQRLYNKEIESKIVGFETKLSARVRKCLINQALGIIAGSIETQRRRKYQIDEHKKKGTEINLNLIEIYRKEMPKKPNVKNSKLELNSLCVDIEDADRAKGYDKWITLKCLGICGWISIPIKLHRNANKFINDGWVLKTSILLDKSSLLLRHEKQHFRKVNGKTLGADQGYKTILTLSNGVTTQKFNKHGYSFEKILHLMAGKKENSKAFKRAQALRENFVNWSINHIDFSDVYRLNIEKVCNIHHGVFVSRVMKHWRNTLIRDKVKSRCEELGVQVTEQGSAYRSQRCSRCGMVKKSNRKKKGYKCCNCGLVIDADLNAAMNHEQYLPEITYGLFDRSLNRTGFFWKPEGLFGLNGVSIQSTFH